MPRKIFISYRKSDVGLAAGRVHEVFATTLGTERVWQDAYGIGFGEDFVQTIDNMLRSCSAMVVLIGPAWAPHKLHQPDDWPRLELEKALARNIRVFPLLLMGARMPEVDELPRELARLSRRQSWTIRDDPHFRSDLKEAAQEIQRSFRRDRWLSPTLGRVALVFGVTISMGASVMFTPFCRHSAAGRPDAQIQDANEDTSKVNSSSSQRSQPQETADVGERSAPTFELGVTGRWRGVAGLSRFREEDTGLHASIEIEITRSKGALFLDTEATFVSTGSLVWEFRDVELIEVQAGVWRASLPDQVDVEYTTGYSVGQMAITRTGSGSLSLQAHLDWRNRERTSPQRFSVDCSLEPLG